MEDQQQQRLELEQRMVRELQVMRVTPTHLSLALNDLKFFVEAPQQRALAELAADCIARSQSRQT